MSKKKRDHDWGEDGFEHWVSIYVNYLLLYLLIFIIIRLLLVLVFNNVYLSGRIYGSEESQTTGTILQYSQQRI